jgi:hypothetical protein
MLEKWTKIQVCLTQNVKANFRQKNQPDLFVFFVRKSNFLKALYLTGFRTYVKNSYLDKFRTYAHFFSD